MTFWNILDKFVIDFTCSHELLGTCHVAILDHFFWSEQLQESVADAGVLHLPDNKSDHSPIYCVVVVPVCPAGSSRTSKTEAKT